MAHQCPHCKAVTGFGLEPLRSMVDVESFEPHQGDTALVCTNCGSILGAVSGADPDEMMSRLSELASRLERIEQHLARLAR